MRSTLWVLICLMLVCYGQKVLVSIDNGLNTSVLCPKIYLSCGGLQSGPNSIAAFSTAEFIFFKDALLTQFSGMMALPIQGYAPKVSFAWNLDKEMPSKNKINVYQGTEAVANSALLATILQAATHSTGWRNWITTDGRLRVNYFISTTNEDPRITIQLRPPLEFQQYWIEPIKSPDKRLELRDDTTDLLRQDTDWYTEHQKWLVQSQPSNPFQYTIINKGSNFAMTLEQGTEGTNIKGTLIDKQPTKIQLWELLPVLDKENVFSIVSVGFPGNAIDTYGYTADGDPLVIHLYGSDYQHMLFTPVL